MSKIFLKKLIAVIGIGVLGFTTIACEGAKKEVKTNTDEIKVIKVGVSPGPYSELFIKGVKPILEKKGYKIEEEKLSDLIQIDIAITEGNIDLNVDQHTAYAENFNKEKGAKLTPITPIPTVPAGIFSEKYKSIENIKKGAIVAIPKDPSNAARAYNILKKAGWIKIKEGVEPIKVTASDIVANPYNIEIKPMQSAQIPRALQDVDFGIIPGSVVYSSGLDAEKVLLQEDVLKKLELVAVVDEKNKDTKWAKDVVAAYKSEEFKKFLVENNKNNYWFIPDELK